MVDLISSTVRQQKRVFVVAGWSPLTRYSPRDGEKAQRLSVVGQHDHMNPLPDFPTKASRRVFTSPRQQDIHRRLASCWSRSKMYSGKMSCRWCTVKNSGTSFVEWCAPVKGGLISSRADAANCGGMRLTAKGRATSTPRRCRVVPQAAGASPFRCMPSGRLCSGRLAGVRARDVAGLGKVAQGNL